MTINIIIEPNYKKTVWCRETMQGIEAKISALRYSLNEIYEVGSGISQLVITGTSLSWVSGILEDCEKYGITPIVTGCRQINSNANYVLINHDAATVACIDYLRKCGRSNIALFGVNDASYADRIKKSYFPHSDTYFINEKTSLEKCTENFIKDSRRFDAVVCTNYITAVYLLKKLRCRVPEDLYVVVYGESVIGQNMSLTAITLDHKTLGERVVSLYRYIEKNKETAAVTVKIPCKIIPAASTGFKPYDETKTPPAFDAFDSFSTDDDISAVGKLENLLREAEEIDFMILKYLLERASVPKMAEKLYMGESTIKYRIKRMVSVGGFENTREMLEAVEKYY